MSYRLHYNANWRDDFKVVLDRERVKANSRRHIDTTMQLCRDAVARGDLAKLDEIQSNETSLESYIDACRREVTGDA